MTDRKVLVEIVACSADDAVQAQVGGADRLELCAAIEVGGLTPSVGLLAETKHRSNLPVMAMVRPRPSGFTYSEAEFETMERDVEALLASGADGLVFGITTETGAIDEVRMRRLAFRADEVPLVIHRAFDLAPDPFEAMETLIDLGFTRILTGGGKKRAEDGLDRLKTLIAYADGRIEVLPGGGIRAGNARRIVDATGADQVHLAPFRKVADPANASNLELAFGEYGAIAAEDVAAVVAALG